MGSWTQGIITSRLASVFCVGGATVLTWIKSRWPTYGNLALYWIASATCLALLWFAFTGYVPFSRRPPEMTTDNIESNVKLWFEDLGMAFKKTGTPDTYFSYSLTTRLGTPLQVSRLAKEKTAYLQLVSTLTLSPQHQAMMLTLSQDQVDAIIEEMALELSKTRIGFTIIKHIPQTGMAVVFQKSIPIADLTES